jgi:phosphoenolpyruvate-protein kinase (PTS system EI component)
MANHLPTSGGMQKMIESMQKEIDKRFSRGIAASPGIVIGKAYVFQDILLLVKRRDLEEGRAEKEIIRLNQAIRQVIDELIEDNFQVSERTRKQEAEIFLTHIAILLRKERDSLRKGEHFKAKIRSRRKK